MGVGLQCSEVASRGKLFARIAAARAGGPGRARCAPAPRRSPQPTARGAVRRRASAPCSLRPRRGPAGRQVDAGARASHAHLGRAGPRTRDFGLVGGRAECTVPMMATRRTADVRAGSRRLGCLSRLRTQPSAAAEKRAQDGQRERKSAHEIE